MCHMESILLLHPLLDLFICSLTLSCGYIQLAHIYLNANMVLRFREFGQCTYSLDCMEEMDLIEDLMDD